MNIPVFLASDNNYAPFVATTIASICDNTKSFCDFYILNSGITDENKEKIRKLKKQFNNFSLEFIEIDLNKYFKNFQENRYITKSMYSRFLIPDLKPQIHKAIYSDIDVIFMGNINQLFCERLDNYIIGACLEQNAEYNLNSKRQMYLNLSDSHQYFCSGLLLIDCQQWREKNITSKLFDSIKNLPPKLECPDQDMLNKLFNNNNYKILSRKYCYINQFCTSNKLPNEVVIRHFNGPDKPWKFNPNITTSEKHSGTIGFSYFWKYAKKTEFYHFLLNNITYHSIQEFNRHNALQLIRKNMQQALLKNKADVTVIIPIYNSEKYLRRCLNSICRQTLENIEILCVDDGSTDKSLKIIQEYARLDNRFTIITHKENCGVAISRNRAINSAKGKYILFCDSDDYLYEDFCQKLYQEAEAKQADIVVSGIEYLAKNETKRTQIPIFKNNLYIDFTFYSALYRKDFLNRFGIRFLQNCTWGEDRLFVVKSEILAQRIFSVHNTYYVHTSNIDSVTSKINYKSLESALYCWQSILDFINTASLSKENYIIITKIFLLDMLSVFNKAALNNLQYNSYFEKAINFFKSTQQSKYLFDDEILSVIDKLNHNLYIAEFSKFQQKIINKVLALHARFSIKREGEKCCQK